MNTFSKMKHALQTAKGKATVLVGAVVLGAQNAVAAITLPTDLDVTAVETMAGLMIGALAVIWVARRVVSFLGR